MASVAPSRPHRVLAIDPGPQVCGAVLLDMTEDPLRILSHWSAVPTIELLEWAQRHSYDFNLAAIETPAPRGMPTAKEELETLIVIGWFEQAIGRPRCRRIRRTAAKMAVCGRANAKDANIRRALLDRYPATGGGREPARGTKAQPGPLYGLSKHAWAALAIGYAVAAQGGQ
jgi:hypothetical protein